MGVSVQIIDRVDWDKMIERGIETLRDVIEEVADKAVEIAKENSPHDTGNNRDSITVGSEKNNKKEINTDIHTESGYGGYLELGTSKMPARPYMQPAVIQALKEVVK
jgi:HK97 gp10 family phage protein